MDQQPESSTQHSGPRLPSVTRRSRRAVAPRFDADPALSMVLGSLALVLAVVVGVLVGWVALLVVVAFLQVVLARGWTTLLDLPGSGPRAVFGAALVTAVIADVGVVVTRVRGDDLGSAESLDSVAPALGVAFLASVVAQLVRRDERDGVLAGLIGGVVGGVGAASLALLLPLEASEAGGGWVLALAAAVGVVGVVVGAVAWVRRASIAVPAGVLLPGLLALTVGPVYVAARITAG